MSTLNTIDGVVFATRVIDGREYLFVGDRKVDAEIFMREMRNAMAIEQEQSTESMSDLLKNWPAKRRRD